MRAILLLLLSPILLAPDLPGSLSPHAGVAGVHQEFESEDRYRVFLLTMDQGDEVWERFGHNALLIRNESTGEELAWNWGLFDFQDVDFIPRFLKGTMLYQMGPAPVQPFLDSYVWADRSIYSNEIHLSQEQARELDEFVRWNYLPENRHYVYDYFRDNCSTRIRDILDRVLDGAIRDRYYERSTPHTYRWHSRRLVQGLFWIDQGMSHLMGTRGDRPITEWEAMFVPMELMRLLEELEVEDETGGLRPLLGPREVLYEARRPPTPTEAPGLPLWWPLVGLGLGALLVGLGQLAGQGRNGARIGLGVAGAGWSLVAGILGFIMTASWFTDHVFIHRNLNLLHTSPLALLLGVLVAAAAMRGRWWEGRPGRLARDLAVLLAALSLGAALLQIVTPIHQGNAEALTLALPVNLGLAVAFLLSRAGGGRPVGSPPPAQPSVGS
jgi:hypothetical protein